MKILFLDESDDHNLSIIDPNYPVFVLGGIIVDKDYAENEMSAEVIKFKQKMFDSSDIILHTADITRNKNGFEKMKEPQFRHYFFTELNVLCKIFSTKLSRVL